MTKQAIELNSIHGRVEIDPGRAVDLVFCTPGTSTVEEEHLATISWPAWKIIAEPVRDTFNQQRHTGNLRALRWMKCGGIVITEREAKELAILAWGIEPAALAILPVALLNWRGLAPEERWWLATMTRMSPRWRSREGWRRALYHALCENPTSLGEVGE